MFNHTFVPGFPKKNFQKYYLGILYYPGDIFRDPPEVPSEKLPRHPGGSFGKLI